MVSPQYETPGYSTKFYTVGSAPSYTLYTYSYIPFLNEKVWMNEWMNEWMIYLMSKTWEVFTQSSEPEAHVKNARQTKKYKTG